MSKPEGLDATAEPLARMAGLLDQAELGTISGATLVDRLGHEMRIVQAANPNVSDTGFYVALIDYEAEPSASGLTSLATAFAALRAVIARAGWPSGIDDGGREPIRVTLSEVPEIRHHR